MRLTSVYRLFIMVKCVYFIYQSFVVGTRMVRVIIKLNVTVDLAMTSRPKVLQGSALLVMTTKQYFLHRPIKNKSNGDTKKKERIMLPPRRKCHLFKKPKELRTFDLKS